MNKQEYEKNPVSHWGTVLIDEEPSPLPADAKHPPLNLNPIWACCMLPEITAKLEREVCLDLGCGAGRYLGYASQYFKKVIGIDFSERNLRNASKLFYNFKNIEFLLTSLGDLSSIMSNTADFAYSAAVFMHMPNTTKKLALAELARVLKPDGYAILVEIVPILNGAFDCPDITQQEWNDMIREAGLIIEDVETALTFKKHKLCKEGGKRLCRSSS